jgi:alpha-L-rhamnosidase
MNSFNHYSLGSVGEWMYRTIAGIDTDSKQAGYKHILIQPQPGGNLTWARGEYTCLYGIIRTDWWITGKNFYLQVDIPVNTTATVVLPGPNVEYDPSLAPYVNRQESSAKATILGIGSGSYSFQVKI